MKFQGFGEDSGGLDGVLVGHLVEVELLAQRLVGGLVGVLWLWRAGVGGGSVQKSVVGQLRGRDEDEQVVRCGHGEVGQDDDEGGGQVVQQGDVQGGRREGACRTRRGRGWAPVQEGTDQSAPPCYPTPGTKQLNHKRRDGSEIKSYEKSKYTKSPSPVQLSTQASCLWPTGRSLK